MDPDVLDTLLSRLRAAGVDLTPGLTDDEFAVLEARCQIRFPPDLRAFLAAAVPIGSNWFAWRPIADVPADLNEPFVEGVLFDVQCNDLWCDEFGEKPEDDDDDNTAAVAQAKEWLTSHAPKLIPLFSHRAMCCEPFVVGQPVLSIHQSDVIVYGGNLASYLAKEFGFEPVQVPDGGLHNNDVAGTDVPFWGQFL
jgi:hypothetical protein